MAPRVDGARAGPLANTLFGAKHRGHCHRQSASTLPSFRGQMLRYFPCVSEGDTEQVVEGLTRLEGRVRQDAAKRVGEAGHGEVEFPVKYAFAKVRGNLEPRFEGANTVPCHGV